MNSWSISTSDIIITITAILFFSYLAIRNIKYSNQRKTTIFLETIRMTIIIMFCLTLFEPEYIKRKKLSKKPLLKVLYDKSGSMKTKDIPTEDKTSISREEAIKNIIKKSTYDELKNHFRISIDGFSGNSEHPDATDISHAINTALQDKTLATLILISDGDWNIGKNPMSAAIKLCGRNIPAFGVSAGSDNYLPDLYLKKADAPSFCIINEKVLIPFTVHNYLDHKVNTHVKMASINGISITKNIQIPAHSRYQDSIMWQPKMQGLYNFSLKIPLEPEETYKDNNEIKFRINVRNELLKVLVIESRPRWEYRYLRNALMRDPGVFVNTLLFHQSNMKTGGGKGYLKNFPSKELLSQYDVVFVGDVGIAPNQLTIENAKLLRGLVENQGSGLVFLPGVSGKHLTFPKSPLGELLPVVFDATRSKGIAHSIPSKLKLSTYGADHLLTMLADTPQQNRNLWRQLPGFYWNVAVEKAKPGTHTLAVHESERTKFGRMPLLVTKPFKNGQVLFMGTDSAWRWRKGVEDKYHYRFWGQVVRWMAHKRHLAYNQEIRLFYYPESPIKNDVVSIKATILSKMRNPLKKATVQCRITYPDKSEKLFNLYAESEEWGMYKNSFKAEQSGLYTVEISCQENGQSITTKINVSTTNIEKQGEPAQHQTLQELAQISKGQFQSYQNFDKILKAIKQLPDQSIIITHHRIWNTWWWGLIIIILFTVYWISRKMSGQI